LSLRVICCLKIRNNHVLIIYVLNIHIITDINIKKIIIYIQYKGIYLL